MPSYEGQVVSILTCLSRQLLADIPRPNSPWQWRPYQLPIRDRASVKRLEREGWERIPLDDRMYQSIVSMQLYDTILVFNPDTQDMVAELWARSTDIAQAIRAPIILAFDLPPQLASLEQARQSIHMLQFLPPPQIGELGLVPVGKDLYAYHISELGDEGQELWRELSDALRTLAAPADWFAHWDDTPLCQDDEFYNDLVAEIKEDIERKQGREQQEARAYLDALTILRQQVLSVRESFAKPDWSAQWSTIQRLARTLAVAYSALHERQRAVGARVVVTHPRSEMKKPTRKTAKRQETEASAPTKRSRQKPADLVARDPKEVLVSSDHVTLQIMRGLLDGNEYIRVPSQTMAIYSKSFAKNKGQMIITILPDEENWEQVLRSLNVLGDEVVDTFVAVVALALDVNRTKEITAPFYVSPDDILAVCDRKKSNGSYTPTQRGHVIEHLRILSYAHVRASLATKKQRGKTIELRAESPIVEVLGGKIGAYETMTETELWVKRSIKIGDWAATQPEMSEQTALLLRQVLGYHSHNQRYEKRLGRYLSLMLRVATDRRGGMFQCTMQALLEQSGITPDLHTPGKIRAAIERALAQLHKDGVIGKYGSVVDSSEEGQKAQTRIQQAAYRWWEDYSRQQWYFSPPEPIRATYLLQEKQRS